MVVDLPGFRFNSFRPTFIHKGFHKIFCTFGEVRINVDKGQIEC